MYPGRERTLFQKSRVNVLRIGMQVTQQVADFRPASNEVRGSENSETPNTGYQSLHQSLCTMIAGMRLARAAMQAGVGQTVQTMGEHERKMMACSTMQHARWQNCSCSLACTFRSALRKYSVVTRCILCRHQAANCLLTFVVNHISRSIHCRCPVSAQSFGPPP